jgi:cytochrome P450
MVSPLRSVPTAPRRLPVIGHALALWRDPLNFLLALQGIDRIVRVLIGTWPVYMLTDPELIHEVLTTQSRSFDKGRLFERARPFVGNGLATSDGEFHRRQRRLIQPAFTKNRIAAYADIMSEEAHRIVGGWQPDGRIMVSQEMHELVLETLAKTIFSADLAPYVMEEARRSIPIIVRTGPIRALTPKAFDAVPIPVNREFDAASARMRAVMERMIDQSRGRAGSDDDLLSLLLTARDPDTGAAMTKCQIRDELLTLLAGGSDNAAITLAWAIHKIARHSAVQQKLHAEVDSVVRNGRVGYAHVAELQYTQYTLQEVMRQHSPLIVMRRASADVNIGGIRIPAGTELAFSLYALHRDRNLYPDPTHFDPDRWLPGSREHGCVGDFIPFGAGNRKCIGDSFAWVEMVIILATILVRWRVEPIGTGDVREIPSNIPYPDDAPVKTVSRFNSTQSIPAPC